MIQDRSIVKLRIDELKVKEFFDKEAKVAKLFSLYGGRVLGWLLGIAGRKEALTWA
jgi:hypothetical protein